MANKVYVLIHHSGGKIHNISYECIALGQQLGQQASASVSAVLMGQDLDSLAEDLVSADLSEVILIQDDKLQDYTPEAYCEAMTQLIAQDEPDLLLIGQVYQNIDFSPKLAARLKTGLVTDCIGFRFEGDELVFTRQMFRNKLNADVVINSGRPWIVAIQAGAAMADDMNSGSAPTVTREVDLSEVRFQRKSLETLEMTKKKVDLAQAEVVLGIGRGIKKEENMEMIHALAETLDAEIGASRPVVDNEWLERDRQIGSSGQTVAPKLYIAVGISGAIQHVVGIKNSGCIVAINSDPNAPIFNVATYGIVGDLLEIVPALTKRLQET